MEECAYCGRATAAPTCTTCGFAAAGTPILVYARLVSTLTDTTTALEAFAALGVVLARGDDDLLVLSTAGVVDVQRAFIGREPRARASVHVVLLADPVAPFASVPDAAFTARDWWSERAVRQQTTAWLAAAEELVLGLAPAGGGFGVGHAAALLGLRRNATTPPTTTTTRGGRLTLVPIDVGEDGALVGSPSVAPDPLR